MKRFAPFTLVEMLVVIAVISILTALLLPSLNLARMKGKEIGCANIKKQLALATLCYADDYEGWMHGSNMESWAAWYRLSALGYLKPLPPNSAFPLKGGYFGATCTANVQPLTAQTTVVTIGYNNGMTYYAAVGQVRFKAASFKHPSDIGLWSCSIGSTLWGGGSGGWGWDSTTQMGYSHQRKTNVSFLDGHAESCSMLELLAKPAWFFTPWKDQ